MDSKKLSWPDLTWLSIILFLLEAIGFFLLIAQKNIGAYIFTWSMVIGIILACYNIAIGKHKIAGIVAIVASILLVLFYGAIFLLEGFRG